jgi:5-methylcytosine-specific restriction enzyme A
VILALDLYRREGRNPSAQSVAEVSEQLRSIPIEPHLADDPRFRNVVGVRMKVANLVALDPEAETEGMSRGSRLDARVFAEFGSDLPRLVATADAIRANLASLTPAEAEIEDDEVEDAPEGRILTRTHQTRERNRGLVRRRKAAAMEADGKLGCEACGFDFAAEYGERHIYAEGGAQAAGPSAAEVEAEIDRIVEGFREAIQDSMASVFHSRDKKGGITKANRSARKLLERRWKKQEDRWGTASGKDIISALSKWSQEQFGVGFGPEQIARSLNPGEIDPEIVEVVTAISEGRTLRAPFAMPK